MSYEPSDSTKRMQKILEGLEDRTQKAAALQARINSGQLALESRLKAIDDEHKRVLEDLEREHQRHLDDMEKRAAKASNDKLTKELDARASLRAMEAERDKLIESADQFKVQLISEMQKAHIIAPNEVARS